MNIKNMQTSTYLKMRNGGNKFNRKMMGWPK